MNFSQTLEKLMGVLIKDSKRPANYGGPCTFISWIVSSLAAICNAGDVTGGGCITRLWWARQSTLMRLAFLNALSAFSSSLMIDKTESLSSAAVK